MKNRVLKLTQEEEAELKELTDLGALNYIIDEQGLTSYREAYFIYKGKNMPSYNVDNAPITRWF